jgi:hypothetical protein
VLLIPAVARAVPTGQDALPEGTVIALQGTPHLWVADKQGVLHWAGDTRALADKVILWDTRREVTLEALQRLPRGDPWLSTGLVKDGEAIYLAKWETEDTLPLLLHIQSIRDVELFGIHAGNYSAYVLDRAEWERRYGLDAATLARAILAPAVTPETPRPLAAAGGDAASARPHEAAGPVVLLADTFDDPARGVLPQTSSHPTLWLVGYQNGEYVVSSVDPLRSGALGIWLPHTYTDVTLAVEARLVAGLHDGYVAIACRAGTGHYRLSVHPDSRSFALTRWDGGRRVALVDWKVSPAVRDWSQTNRLELRCAGTTIAASINGVQVAAVQDGTYREGRLWIGAGVFRDTRTLITARFDNLLVTRP